MVAKRSANELSEARGVGGTIIYQGQGPYLTKAPRRHRWHRTRAPPSQSPSPSGSPPRAREAAEEEGSLPQDAPDEEEGAAPQDADELQGDAPPSVVDSASAADMVVITDLGPRDKIPTLQGMPKTEDFRRWMFPATVFNSSRPASTKGRWFRHSGGRPEALSSAGYIPMPSESPPCLYSFMGRGVAWEPPAVFHRTGKQMVSALRHKEGVPGRLADGAVRVEILANWLGITVPRILDCALFSWNLLGQASGRARWTAARPQPAGN
jgi:hypothetical protein